MKLFEPRPAPSFAGYSVAAIQRGLLKTWPDYKEHVQREKKSKKGKKKPMVGTGKVYQSAVETMLREKFDTNFGRILTADLD